jgi:hypothetical protein
MVHCVTVKRRNDWRVTLWAAAISLACSPSEDRPGALEDPSTSEGDATEPDDTDSSGNTSNGDNNTASTGNTDSADGSDASSNGPANGNGEANEADAGLMSLPLDPSNEASSTDAGGSLGGTLFDENAVYLVAERHVFEGDCYLPIVNLQTGSHTCGMSYASEQAIIHDSKLLHLNDSNPPGLFELVPEPPAPPLVDPIANDELLTTLPPCTDDNLIWSWQLSPSGGRVHQCSDGFWYDTEGSMLSQSDIAHELMRAMTDTKVALMTAHFEQTPHVELLDLAADRRIAVPDLSNRLILAARANGSGIRVAVAGTETDEVWDINPDGSADFITSLAPLPNDLQRDASQLSHSFSHWRAWFSGAFALYEIVKDVPYESEAGAIVIRTMDGDLDVLPSGDTFLLFDGQTRLITGR